jgi:hypothetical protein
MHKLLYLFAAAFFFSISSVYAADCRVARDPIIDPEIIFGGVRHASTDKPIRDVTITFFHQNSTREKTIQTNANGEFGVDDLRPGIYKIVFQKDGYKKVVKDKITVKPDAGIELQIEMEEAGYELSPSPFHFFKF